MTPRLSPAPKKSARNRARAADVNALKDKRDSATAGGVRGDFGRTSIALVLPAPRGRPS